MNNLKLRKFKLGQLTIGYIRHPDATVLFRCVMLASWTIEGVLESREVLDGAQNSEN